LEALVFPFTKHNITGAYLARKSTTKRTQKGNRSHLRAILTK